MPIYIGKNFNKTFLNKLGNFLNLRKNFYIKVKANIIVKRKIKLYASLLEKRQRGHFYPVIVNVLVEFLIKANKYKVKKGFQLERKVRY